MQQAIAPDEVEIETVPVMDFYSNVIDWINVELHLYFADNPDSKTCSISLALVQTYLHHSLSKLMLERLVHAYQNRGWKKIEPNRTVLEFTRP